MRMFINACVFLVLGLAFFSFPGAMEYGSLDWTWNGALSYFVAKKFQFGTDIIYTHGPLGYLHSGVYSGYLWNLKIVGSLLIAALSALVVTRLITRGRSVLLAIPLTFAAVLFGRFNADAPILAVIAIASCLSVDARSPIVGLLLVGGVLGFLSLGKFTYLLLSVFSLGVIGTYFLVQRDFRRLAAIGAGFGVSFVFFWLVSGQRLGSLPSFLWGSVEVASGYPAAMFTPPSPWQFWHGVAEVVVLSSMSVYMILAARKRIIGVFRAWLLGGAVFLGWKEGFVRADQNHAITLFILAQYLSVLAFVLTADLARSGEEIGKNPRNRAWWKRRGFVLSGILLMLALAVSYSALRRLSRFDGFKELLSVRVAVEGQYGKVHNLLHVRDYRKLVEFALDQAREKSALPRLKARINGHTVDVFGNEGGVAILNGLEYRPRPMFQSFSAYNQYLLERNERYYEGEQAPKFIIFKYQAIDEKLPCESDSKALEAVLWRYRPIDAEGGYTLWERREGNSSIPSAHTYREGQAALNEAVSLEPLPQQEIQSLVIDLKYSLLGKVRNFLFQPAEMYLRVTTKSGEVNEFRLTLPLAREGIIINPPLRSGIELLAFLQGRSDERIVSFEMRPGLGAAVFFKPRFHFAVQASKCPTFGPLPARVSQSFLPFEAEPYEIKAAFYPRVMSVDEHEVLFAHAPSQMVFDVPKGAREISGKFGVLPGAFDQDTGTKGVEFTVEADGDRGSIVLQTVVLRKSEALPFRTFIAEPGVKRIVLRANCDGTCDGAWSYWDDISFK